MTTNIHEAIHSRAYVGDDDFWRVRELLVETYPMTPPGFNWDIRRWDGWNYHCDDLNQRDKSKIIRLWETEGGRLAGAAHADWRGDVVLELHPDYRQLEAEMLAWAEEELSIPAEDGQTRQLETFVFDYDIARIRLLQARGYEQMPDGSVFQRQRFGNRALPSAEMPPGYRMRTTLAGDLRDCERMAALLNAAFQRDFHTSREYANFVTLSPSFRHDLNLIAEAEDGRFAAHVGITFDVVNLWGIFEPVCTHPQDQRKGLARALITEGLYRLRALGATDAYVGTGDGMAANWLYEVTGFTEVYHGHVWRKYW